MRKWIISSIIGICLALIAIYFVLAPSLHVLVRKRMETDLSTHFKSSVQLGDFHMKLWPHVHVEVTGLVLRHQGRTDIPPLIEIQAIEMDATFLGILTLRPEIASVRLVGLRIHTPPRKPGGKSLIQGTTQNLAEKYPAIIREIRADDALVTILPADPSKTPREFPIHQLVMNNFDFSHPVTFHALVENPKPLGEIHCDGQFGPWQADVPSLTPVSASYTFSNADLGTINGLRGILSSTGKFAGPLDYLDVEGSTDTPNFGLRISGHEVSLHTDFLAIVDGTNGNTTLKSVTAKFAHSTIQAQGGIVDVSRATKGRTVELDAFSQDARIEDLILLAVKTYKSVMTGSVKLKARIDIPEGDADLIQRLKLNGQFGVDSAQFTSEEVQGKINSLSRRGEGRPKDTDMDTALSELHGKFKLDNGLMTFSDLSFGVTGATISLAGTYDINNGQLDFWGKLRLQAKLSQTTTGVKSFFLKALDPFFKGGEGVGTVLPIKITGTKDHPSFGLDFHDKSNTK